MKRRVVIFCSVLVVFVALLAWDMRPERTRIDIEDAIEPLNIVTIDNDYWGAGRFGYEPSKIRRVDVKFTVKGEPMERIIYFAKLDFSKPGFENEYAKWKTEPKYAFHPDFRPPDPLPSYWPSWFPLPLSENYLGNLYFPQEFQVYQPKGSSDVYLFSGPFRR